MIPKYDTNKCTAQISRHDRPVLLTQRYAYGASSATPRYSSPFVGNPSQGSMDNTAVKFQGMANICYHATDLDTSARAAPTTGLADHTNR